MDFFPSSFSLIFFRPFHHPFHPSIWFQLFACLIRAAIFHLTLAFVLLFFLYNFATGLCVQLLSWLFCCCFCFVFLPQVFAFSFFSACLALVLVFSVSLPLESFSGRQHMMSDFRWFSVLSSVQIKPESLYGASSFRIICSIGLSFPQSSLLLHLVQTLWYCPKKHENYLSMPLL